MTPTPTDAARPARRPQLILKVAPDDGAPRAARGLVRLAWGVMGFGDSYDAEVVVSELVTNCVLWAAQTSPAILVHVYPETENALAVIEVMDGSRELPHEVEAGPDAESGRGMAIVRELVKDYQIHRSTAGKVVRVALTAS